ncbi:hypothetical protein HMPREF3217_00098 [Finegoldia magna]|nr:hypothetical protein HMPREF3217_00098 [Finegoldia magna]
MNGYFSTLIACCVALLLPKLCIKNRVVKLFSFYAFLFSFSKIFKIISIYYKNHTNSFYTASHTFYKLFSL